MLWWSDTSLNTLQSEINGNMTAFHRSHRKFVNNIILNWTIELMADTGRVALLFSMVAFSHDAQWISSNFILFWFLFSCISLNQKYIIPSYVVLRSLVRTNQLKKRKEKNHIEKKNSIELAGVSDVIHLLVVDTLISVFAFDIHWLEEKFIVLYHRNIDRQDVEDTGCGPITAPINSIENTFLLGATSM